METLEQLQHQLGSINDLHSLVRTMKALSAVNIHQYEQAVSALDGYFRTIQQGLYVVLKDTDRTVSTDRSVRRDSKTVAIVFGSDHGLCARFNEDISQFVMHDLSAIGKEDHDCQLFGVGSRVVAILEAAGRRMDEEFIVPASAAQITLLVQNILLRIDAARQQSGELSVFLYYNRREGNREAVQTKVQLLPMDLAQFRQYNKGSWPSRRLPAYSMGQQVLLGRLIHQHLFVSLFRACAESQASEHASRLSAMQAAQRNLEERLEEVTLAFRHARQTAITAEMQEVMGGFETITHRSQ